MDGELSEITLENGNNNTTIIFRENSYSDKIELNPIKYDEMANSNSIQDANIYVEANSRGPCRLFYVPVQDCLGELELVTSDLSQVPGEILTPTSENSGEIDQPLSGSLFSVTSSELPQSELSEKMVELNASSVPPVQTELPAKRKGGWPKGKKRKKEAEGTKPPKAPLTGYVIFLNRQRQLYKERHPEIPFAEVTKLLGSEWSNLPAQDKQKYLDEAEVDKKRYREELKAYQETEAYKEFLKRKRIKSQHNAASGLSENFDSEIVSDDLDDEESHELYCKVCNQFFNSLHNKKEHLYGKHHLQAITGEFQKEAREATKSSSEDDSLTTCDLGSNLLVSYPQRTPNDNECKCPGHKKPEGPVDVNESMQQLTETILIRESEIGQLRIALGQAKEKRETLTKKLLHVEELEMQLQQELKDLKSYETTLNTQLESLRMVPMLFGVINF